MRPFLNQAGAAGNCTLIGGHSTVASTDSVTSMQLESLVLISKGICGSVFSSMSMFDSWTNFSTRKGILGTKYISRNKDVLFLDGLCLK